MCIVIDINTLASVFNSDCERHPDFIHVKQWIEDRNGCVVFGGTKYKEELKKTIRYLKLVRLLKDTGKAIKIADNIVDDLEKNIITLTAGTDCDDQHIIAILGASRCFLLCSADLRSYPYIKNRTLYPKGTPKIKIYSSAKNKNLLRPIHADILMNVAG